MEKIDCQNTSSHFPVMQGTFHCLAPFSLLPSMKREACMLAAATHLPLEPEREMTWVSGHQCGFPPHTDSEDIKYYELDSLTHF